MRTPCSAPASSIAAAGALVLGASVITSRMDPAGEGWLPKDLNHVSNWLGCV
jgi:hypothetical protein